MMNQVKNKFFISASLVLGLTILSACHSSKIHNAAYYNKTVEVSSEDACSKKGGYWYQGKCWANFEDMDDDIANDKIDAFVANEISNAKKYHITINGEKGKNQFFFPEQEGDEMILVSTFLFNNEPRTILSFCKTKDMEKGKFITKTSFLKGDLINTDDEDDYDIKANTIAKGELVATVLDKEKSDFKIAGSISNESNTQNYVIDIVLGESLSGMGQSSVVVEGDHAILNGILGTSTYHQIKNLITNHPKIKTLILEDVPGSINDAVNMHTGRIIREAGISTVVKSDSQISSGGVDIFCAGKERIVYKGAKLGIHSWGGDGISADDLPKDHPAHQYQINYFTMCLGATKGPDFYFHTLNSAPAGDMHWMTDQEIKDWKITTKFIQ